VLPILATPRLGAGAKCKRSSDADHTALRAELSPDMRPLRKMQRICDAKTTSEGLQAADMVREGPNV
jgi:hypothetical protein